MSNFHILNYIDEILIYYIILYAVRHIPNLYIKISFAFTDYYFPHVFIWHKIIAVSRLFHPLLYKDLRAIPPYRFLFGLYPFTFSVILTCNMHSLKQGHTVRTDS